MSAAEPSRSRKLVFSLLTAILLWVVLELFAFVVHMALGGSLYTPSRAKDERDQVYKHAVARSNLSSVEDSEATRAESEEQDRTAPGLGRPREHPRVEAGVEPKAAHTRVDLITQHRRGRRRSHMLGELERDPELGQLTADLRRPRPRVPRSCTRCSSPRCARA